MAKRFVDTELWRKEWYQDLNLKEKLLVKYIFENCDVAGVWNANFRLASFIIGETISIDDLKAINDKKHQFDILDNGNVFVSDFIKFQYGTLSENCKPHKPIIERLKKYNLFERVSKGYPKGIETLEEKEKEKEKDKEKEKEIVKKVDPFINPVKTFFSEQYTQIMGKTPRLSFMECQRLTELASENPDIKEIIPEAIKKLKVLKFDGISFSPSASWLLKGNNFERLLNGEFDAPETEYERLKRKFGGS